MAAMAAMMTAIDIEKTTSLKIGDNDNKTRKKHVSMSYAACSATKNSSLFLLIIIKYVCWLFQRKSLWYNLQGQKSAQRPYDVQNCNLHHKTVAKL